MAIKALILALLAALATPAWASAEPGHDKFTVTTQNVRVGMSRAHSQHDISQAAEFSSIVITQEMDYRDTSTYRPSPAWRSVHFGPRGNDRGDCATFYNNTVWRKLNAWVTQVSFAPFKHGHRWALTTILRNRTSKDTLAVICVHMFTKTVARNAVFMRTASRIGALAQRMRAKFPYVIIGGDWNRIWDMRARFRGFASVKPQRPTGGNGSGGRIDYWYWTRQTLGQTRHRVVGPTFSDHDGFRVHLAGSVF